MAKVETTGGNGPGGQVEQTQNATQAPSSGGGFSAEAKSAIGEIAKDSGAFEDKKLTGEEVSGIRDELEASSPELAKSLEGMSDEQFKKEMETAFADQLGEAEEAGGAEEAKPEEAKAEEAKPAKGGGGSGGGGGPEAAGGEGKLGDLNGDGKIDEKDAQMLKDLMKKFDTNKDGKLDKKEMEAVPEDMKAKLDPNGDGEASKEEIGKLTGAIDKGVSEASEAADTAGQEKSLENTQSIEELIAA